MRELNQQQCLGQSWSGGLDWKGKQSHIRLSLIDGHFFADLTKGRRNLKDYRNIC